MVPKTLNLNLVREALKKTFESVSMLIPRGRGGGGCYRQRSHLLRFFFAWSKPTCLALGSLKTNFVLTPNSMFHIFSDLFDHQNQPYHPQFVKFWLSFFCREPTSLRIGIGIIFVRWEVFANYSQIPEIFFFSNFFSKNIFFLTPIYL